MNKYLRLIGYGFIGKFSIIILFIEISNEIIYNVLYYRLLIFLFNVREDFFCSRGELV